MGEILTENARHITAQANIDARRITAVSGNKKRGAQASLEQFEQSVGNQHIMDAAGRQANEITENLSRNLDAAVNGKLSERLQAAEELGAATVDAAAAGIGGSSIDSYNNTLRLQEAMAEEQGDRQVNTQAIAAGRAKGDTITNAVADLGNNVYDANLDVSQYVDDHKMSGLAKITTVAAAAAATYFGGPQAGEAVMQVSMANQRAKNGDLDGASKEFGQALNNGLDGAKLYRSTGQPWGKTVYNGIHIH